MINVGGIVPLTTIDFPGRLSAVIFCQGCPLRCVYCSNTELLECRETDYDWNKIVAFLEKRSKVLDGVVFSGGEALMQPDIIPAMKQVKDMGYEVAVHTNGFYIDRLKQALPLLDWIGLDIKTLPSLYRPMTGIPKSGDYAIESLDLILQSNVPFEVRTTCDPRFLTKEIILELAQLLSKKGVKHYALQEYKPYNEDKTTDDERQQFFVDEEFKKKVTSLFDTVDFRR